jgi:DNA-binding transcriptional MocR family regulator
MRYKEISEAIITRINNKEFKNGSRLPSIRNLSSEYQCNKSTIIKALSLLEKDNFCYGVPRSGYYVIEKEIVKVSTTIEYDFKHVKIHKEYLPYKEFHHCATKAIISMDSNLYQYGDPKGLFCLRNTVYNQLFEEGIYSDAKGIVMTSGAIQGINYLLQLIKKQGKSLLIESPTYSSIIKMIKFLDIDYDLISRINKGYDLKELEEKLKAVDYFYIIPNHHNPLGDTLSYELKQKVLKLCKKYDVYIIEDDYLADIVTDIKTKSLRYYDENNSVIYIRSFSKGFLPGIRLGYVEFPKTYEYLDDFVDIKLLSDYCTSSHNQYALYYFIQTGMYKRHIYKIRNVYIHRMTIIKGALESLLPNWIQCNFDKTGIFLYFHINKEIDGVLLKKLLDKRKIKVAFNNEFLTGDVTSITGIRLCIASYSIDDILVGLKELIALLNSL